jgi:hypothetical protein
MVVDVRSHNTVSTYSSCDIVLWPVRYSIIYTTPFPSDRDGNLCVKLPDPDHPFSCTSFRIPIYTLRVLFIV